MKKLVITNENPKDAPIMNESLEQQGHKYCTAYVDDNGVKTAEALYHCTPDMLKNAEMPKKAAAKAEPKKAAAKAPAKAEPKKAAAKK